MRHASGPREVTCRTCKLVSPYVGFPDGWYQLTVNDPAAPNGKYRYLGVFCSIACIARHLPVMSSTEADIQGRHEGGRW